MKKYLVAIAFAAVAAAPALAASHSRAQTESANSAYASTPAKNSAASNNQFFDSGYDANIQYQQQTRWDLIDR
jgi:opacity protein-like surface antigen